MRENLVLSRLFLSGFLAILVAGCASRPRAIPTPATPPATSIADPRTSLTRIWHLRAALNVAALSCPARTGPAIVQRYNAILKDRRAILAAAWAAETDRFRRTGDAGWQAAFDTDMTRLYNRFASPGAQPRFCIAADAIASEAASVAPADFEAFAATALARIERILDTPEPQRSSPPIPTAVTAGLGWRIQLGAFTGTIAAANAWAQVTARLPSLARYTPLYESVPGRPGLVRVQIAAADNRQGALTLCALAAAGGFDCLPVRR